MAWISKQGAPELKAAHSRLLATMSQEVEAVLEKHPSRSPGKEVACQRLHEKIAQLQQTLAAESSDRQVVSALHARAMDQLVSTYAFKMEQLVFQHETEAKKWESMRARPSSEDLLHDHVHSSDGKLFRFTVRGLSGNPFCGSVPRSIFEAEPDSALAHMYSGEWEYVKDREGRAVVNSDPANWPLILNWLSFGTVPSNPSDSLLTECRYWQLDKLLAAVDAKDNVNMDNGITQADAGSHCLSIKRASMNGNDGFTISGLIHKFLERIPRGDLHSCTGNNSLRPLCIPLTVAGRRWRLEINQTCFKLAMLTGPPLTASIWAATWGSGPLAVKCRYPQTALFEVQTPFTCSKGLSCTWNAGKVSRILHPRMLSLEGSLQMTMTLIFKDIHDTDVLAARARQQQAAVRAIAGASRRGLRGR